MQGVIRVSCAVIRIPTTFAISQVDLQSYFHLADIATCAKLSPLSVVGDKAPAIYSVQNKRMRSFLSYSILFSPPPFFSRSWFLAFICVIVSLPR